MAGQTDWTAVCSEGGELSAGDAAKLEVVLETAPDDARARALLLGYYFTRISREAQDRRSGHVLWLIENRPELDFGAYNTIHQSFSPEAYARAKQLWLSMVESRPDDTTILRRASAFLMVEDIAVTENLLRRGAALEPEVAYWRDRLAHLYSLVAKHGKTAAQRLEAARASFAENEAALRLEASPVGRYCLLIDAAEAALLAEEYAQATEYANRVLAQASEHRGTWVYGNGIHHGHIVLGRVALANDDIQTAREQLAAAGTTPGSPQLNSFGPDQHLAAELLARGEREAVTAYVEACRRFYRGGFSMF